MPSVDVSIAAGNGDAAYEGESWVSNGTTLTASAASSAWLQFPLTLPRNTAIASAVLTVVPSSTSLIVPNVARVAFASLFDADLATDRSAMLADLDGESQPTFAAWTSSVAVALDITTTLQAWIHREEIPTDDSGAYCTLVMHLDPMDPSSYSLASFEHATLAAASLAITWQPAAIMPPARSPIIGLGIGIGL